MLTWTHASRASSAVLSSQGSGLALPSLAACEGMGQLSQSHDLGLALLTVGGEGQGWGDKKDITPPPMLPHGRLVAGPDLLSSYPLGWLSYTAPPPPRSALLHSPGKVQASLS